MKELIGLFCEVSKEHSKEYPDCFTDERLYKIVESDAGLDGTIGVRDDNDDLNWVPLHHAYVFVPEDSPELKMVLSFVSKIDFSIYVAGEADGFPSHLLKYLKGELD